MGMVTKVLKIIRSTLFSLLGAAVMLSPAEGVELDPEDSATGMVCVELVSPDMVERSVYFTFTFMAVTAGMCE